MSSLWWLSVTDSTFRSWLLVASLSIVCKLSSVSSLICLRLLVEAIFYVNGREFFPSSGRSLCSSWLGNLPCQPQPIYLYSCIYVECCAHYIEIVNNAVRGCFCKNWSSLLRCVFVKIDPLSEHLAKFHISQSKLFDSPFLKLNWMSKSKYLLTR